MLSEHLLKQLNELRLKGLHCDLVVIANDATSFQLHQLVFLALNRRHFQMALKRAELKEDLVTHKKMYMHLSSLTAMELKLVVEFWYGSKTGKKNEYNMLVEALKKVDMVYLLEEAGEFILEDDLVSIKKEVENLPVYDISALSDEISEQTQNIREHDADVQGLTVEKNSETDQSYIAMDSVEIKQEPFSPESSENTSSDSNSTEAEMFLNETTDTKASTSVDTITGSENQVDVNEIVSSVLVTNMIRKNGQSLTDVEAELNLDTENSNQVDTCMYDQVKAESCTSLSNDLTSKDESCKQSVTNHSYTNEVLVPMRTAKISKSLQGECSIQTDNFAASPTKLRQLLPKPVVYVSQGPKPIAYLCHGPTYPIKPSSLSGTAVTSRDVLLAPVISVSSLLLDKKSLPPLTSSVVSTSKLNSASESLSSFVSVVSTTEPIKVQPYSGKCSDLTSGSHTESELHPRTISVSSSCDLTLATTKTSTILETRVLHTSASPLLNTTVSHVLNTVASPVLHTTVSPVLNTSVSSVLKTTASSVLNTRASSVSNTKAPCEENRSAAFEVNASYEVDTTAPQEQANAFFTGTKNLARNGDPSAVLYSASKRNANTTGRVKKKLKWKPLFKKSKAVEIKCSKENPSLCQISKEATKHTESLFPPVFEKEDGSECNDLEETEVLVESAASFLKISAQALIKKENESHKTGSFLIEENKEITSNKEDDRSLDLSSECKLEEYVNGYAYDSDKLLESQSQKCIIPSSEILTLTFEQILAAKKKKEIQKSSENNTGICPLTKKGGNVTVSESCVVSKEVSSSIKAAINKRQKLLNYINSAEQKTPCNSFNDFLTPAEAASKGCIIPLSEICTLSPDDIRAAKRQKTYTIGEGVSKNLNMNDSVPKSTSEKQKGNDLQKQSTGCSLSKKSCNFTQGGTESLVHRKGTALRVYVVSKFVPSAVTNNKESDVLEVVSSADMKNKKTSGIEVIPSADMKNKGTSGSEYLDESESLAIDKGNDVYVIKTEAEETEVSDGIDRIPDQENIEYQKGMNLEEALSKERQAMHDIYGYETESSLQTKVGIFQPKILKVQVRPVLPSTVHDVMAGGGLPLNSCSIRPEVSQTLIKFPLSEKSTVSSNQATVFVADKSEFECALNPQYPANFVDKNLRKTEKSEEKRKRHKSLHEGLSFEKKGKIKRLKRSCSQEHLKSYSQQDGDKSSTTSEQDSSDDETDIPLSELKERIDSAKETLESVIETVSGNNVDNIDVELEINEMQVPEKPENFKDRTDISDNTYSICHQTQKFLCKECLHKDTCMCTHTDNTFYGPVVDLTKTDCKTAGFSLGIPGVIQENRSRRVSISNTTPELKRVLMAPSTDGTRNVDKQITNSSSRKCDCNNVYCVIDKKSGMCRASLQRKKKGSKNQMKKWKNQPTKERYDFKVKTMQEKLSSGKAERERLKNRKRRMESLKKKKSFHAASCLNGTNTTIQQSSNTLEQISFQCSGSITKSHLPHPVILQCFLNETQKTVSEVPSFSIKDCTLSALTSKTNPVAASLNRDSTLSKARPILPKLSLQSVSLNMSSVAVQTMSSPVITSEAQMTVAGSAASYTWSPQILFPTVTSSALAESPVISSVTSSKTRSDSKSSNIALATPVLTSILTSQPLGSVPSPSVLILRTSDQVQSCLES